MRAARTLRTILMMLAAGGSALSAAAQTLTGDSIATGSGDLIIHPVNHATLVMQWNDTVIYVDPVGGGGPFAGLPVPDLIFVTDVHGDHLDPATLAVTAGLDTTIIAPAAVTDELSADLREQVVILGNGAHQSFEGVDIEVIPMYNLTQGRLQYHDKGRGNGYVLTLGGTRVYIAGDTEDIPEMRLLEDIDVAFVPMNLPYTMTEEQAADAVNAFRPRIVYPYHYRGSDVEKFQSLVEAGSDGVEVRLRNWYP